MCAAPFHRLAFVCCATCRAVRHRRQRRPVGQLDPFRAPGRRRGARGVLFGAQPAPRRRAPRPQEALPQLQVSAHGGGGGSFCAPVVAVARVRTGGLFKGAAGQQVQCSSRGRREGGEAGKSQARHGFSSRASHGWATRVATLTHLPCLGVAYTLCLPVAGGWCAPATHAAPGTVLGKQDHAGSHRGRCNKAGPVQRKSLGSQRCLISSACIAAATHGGIVRHVMPPQQFSTCTAARGGPLRPSRPPSNFLTPVRRQNAVLATPCTAAGPGRRGAPRPSRCTAWWAATPPSWPPRFRATRPSQATAASAWAWWRSCRGRCWPGGRGRTHGCFGSVAQSARCAAGLIFFSMQNSKPGCQVKQ